MKEHTSFYKTVTDVEAVMGVSRGLSVQWWWNKHGGPPERVLLREHKVVNDSSEQCFSEMLVALLQHLTTPKNAAKPGVWGVILHLSRRVIASSHILWLSSTSLTCRWDSHCKLMLCGKRKKKLCSNSQLWVPNAVFFQESVYKATCLHLRCWCSLSFRSIFCIFWW